MNSIKDNEYEDTIIKSVSESNGYYSIERIDGWSFDIDKKYNVIPEVNDKIRFYGRGMGFTVRGVAINGKVLYYKTKEQEREDHKKYCEELEQKRKNEFEENKNSLDEKYNALPEIFKKRIDKFRASNKNFRWEYENYEMFCCEEAVKIANCLKTEENINKWKDLSYEEQIKLVPIDKGHSGNTFGCAVSLAKLYITSPAFVELAHGALTPLVGCKEYGCNH